LAPYDGRILRIRILTIAAGLALSACFGQPANSDATYGSHSYMCCLENTILSWHAGQRVILHWQATPPQRTTDPKPHEIVLTISLTGPFPSVEALKQATSQGVRPPGVTTTNAAPIKVNDRDVVSPASELDLPSDLAHGYYNLATEAVEAGQSARGGAVINVVR
jgi:hypothetical protein